MLTNLLRNARQTDGRTGLLSTTILQVGLVAGPSCRMDDFGVRACNVQRYKAPIKAMVLLEKSLTNTPEPTAFN